MPWRLVLLAGEPRDDGGEGLQVGLEGDEVGNAPAIAARVESFHHLIHGPDQHVGSLEDLLDAELLPALLQLLGRLTPAIRYDHPLELRAQLETTESLAGRFLHHPHALIDARHLPSRHVRHRAALSECDAREIHGIGLLRRQREEAKAMPPMMMGGWGRWTGSGW